MKISKQAWHYRFNSYVQGFSFEDRADNRRLTTCSYIRTTMRSFFQKFAEYLFYTALAIVMLFYTVNAIYVPIAAILGFTLAPASIGCAVAAWLFIFFFLLVFVVNKYSGVIKAALSARQQNKLSLLEQRIQDGKDGICTIVEVV